MPSLNKVMLIGNLTRDPEVRYTPKGSAVADISMAINRVYTAENNEKREEVTYFDIVLWARLAELAGQYLHKGSPLFVEGRLQLESWEDKQTGQKRSRLRVVGENMQFLGDRDDKADGPARANCDQPQRQSGGQRQSRPPAPKSGGFATGVPPQDQGFDDDSDSIPF